MAGSAARKLHYDSRYRSGDAVYGDLAYSLEREADARSLPRRTEHAIPKPQARPRVRTAVQVQVREKQSVSPVAVLGVLSVIAAAVLVLMSYVHLTVLSSSVVKLKKELTALETQNVTLTAEYEQIYDLASVKEAAEEAGMSKPGSSQIYYIDLSEDDNAIVYQQEEPGVLSRLLSSLHHGFYTVVEYFD